MSLNIGFLVDIFFFLFRTLNISVHCFVLYKISNEKIWWLQCWVSTMWWVTPLSLLSKFFLSLSFNSLIIMCLGVNFFEFILFRVCWLFRVFLFMSFIKFSKFWPLTLQIFPFLFLKFPQCKDWSIWWYPTGQ